MRGNLKPYGIGAVGGALGTAAVLAVYFVLTAAVRGADVGDWLNFAGVIFGVAATIGGTLAIERIKGQRDHANAVAGMIEALNIWTVTVGTITEELTPAKIGDLRQQHAYLVGLSEDLRRDARAIRLMAHAFNFHAPSMINALERAMNDMQGGAQAIVIGHVANEMTKYSQLLRTALQTP